MSKAHKEVIRILVEEAINKGNLSVLDELALSNYVYRSGSETLHGPEAVKGLIAAYRAAFPDLKMRIDDLVSEGDKTVNCFTITGTHQGNFMGIAATGKQVEIKGVVLSRFDTGKIIEEWEILDQLAMFQQLGVVSLPA